MKTPRLRPSPLVIAAYIGVASLLNSCQEASSPTEPSGSTITTYEASIPGLPGTWVNPDSILWSIDGVVSQAQLSFADREIVTTASLASAPTDTVDISLFASQLFPQPVSPSRARPGAWASGFWATHRKSRSTVR